MERAEARRTLGFLQAVRQAVPASLDNSNGTRTAYEQFEAALVAKANGAMPEKARRWQPSKSKTRTRPETR